MAVERQRANVIWDDLTLHLAAKANSMSVIWDDLTLHLAAKATECDMGLYHLTFSSESQ